MVRKLILWLCLIMLPAVQAHAQEADKNDPPGKGAPSAEKKANEEAKELSGMSIVGNDEAPKSLYIVPWKSSEIGVETSLTSMLNERDAPVDRDVFMRQLEFYRISRSSSSSNR